MSRLSRFPAKPSYRLRSSAPRSTETGKSRVCCIYYLQASVHLSVVSEQVIALPTVRPVFMSALFCTQSSCVSGGVHVGRSSPRAHHLWPLNAPFDSTAFRKSLR